MDTLRKQNGSGNAHFTLADNVPKNQLRKAFKGAAIMMIFVGTAKSLRLGISANRDAHIGAGCGSVSSFP